MQFEYGAPKSSCGWVVDELSCAVAPSEKPARHPERPPVPTDEGYEHLAEEPGGFLLAELYPPDRLPRRSHLDHAPAGRAQVARRVDISKRADQPALAPDP